MAGRAPHKTVAGIERVPNLALPVVVVCDEARAPRALVSDAAALLACAVYLRAS